MILKLLSLISIALLTSVVLDWQQNERRQIVELGGKHRRWMQLRGIQATATIGVYLRVLVASASPRREAGKELYHRISGLNNEVENRMGVTSSRMTCSQDPALLYL